MRYSILTQQVQEKSYGAFDALQLSVQNLSNISTPGYKGQRSGLIEGQSERNMSAAVLELTENPNDITLQGKGFFALTDTNGDQLLTRNLNLTRSKDGYLQSWGKNISPEIKLKDHYSKYEIGADGQVFGIDSKHGRIKLGKLEVLHYPAAQQLEFDGIFYHPTEAAGPQQTLEPGHNKTSIVRQGARESSNVQLPLAIAELQKNNQQISILASLARLLNTSERQYIQNQTQIANGQ